MREREKVEPLELKLAFIWGGGAGGGLMFCATVPIPDEMFLSF